MKIRCSHIRTLFSQPDVDYIIAVYLAELGGEVEGEFVAKGNSLPLDPFLDITLDGEFADDKQGRTALVVKSCTARVRRTRANVLGYLSSGAIKGIGPALAKDIVDAFGLEAVDVLEQNPERLREISGIGEHKLKMIMESFEENREIQDLMQYLGQFDISVNKAQRIVKKFGARSLEILQNDIYYLCEIHGFGFLTVDQMAQKIGHPMNTFPRVKAAAEYIMGENRQSGHLCIEPDGFLKALKKALNHKKASYIFEDADLRPMANDTLRSEKIVYSHGFIYLKQDYRNERGSAILIARRLAHENPVKVIDYAIPANGGIQLSKEQERAVRMALARNTSIITGGPGTGKTTTLKTFLRAYTKHFGKDAILLCAPTGRAARRMAETTGYEASTIHRAFGLGSEDEEDTDERNISEWNLVIIDEFSMADQWLTFQVLSRIGTETKLVIVGDAGQLPSVGPGNVLHELLSISEIPRVQLRQIFRQAGDSAIAENSRRINEVQTDLIYDDSFLFVPAENQRKALQIVCTLYQRATSKLGTENIQILTPQRKNGECGANTLNAVIQKQIQRQPEKGKKIFDRYFCEGDPVIQNKNHKGIANGDVGMVSETAPSSVKVMFSSLDLERKYDDESLRMLELAYALTVHKSQGSEYPVVIIPVLREHRFMLTRNLFYTAVTRGKKRVVLVGHKSAIKKAIMTEDTSKRRTLLALRIKTAIQEMKGENDICNQADSRASA